MLDPRDLPTGRMAPPEIVRGLKEVDPTAELVYFGSGRWDLLRLRPKNDTRIQTAARMLTVAAQACEVGKCSERGWYQNLRFARLVREGYVVFARYRLPRDPDWRIVREFREALWAYHHDHNDAEATKRWSGKERKIEQLQAEFSDPARAREAARALRNPTTLTMPGAPVAA